MTIYSDAVTNPHEDEDIYGQENPYEEDYDDEEDDHNRVDTYIQSKMQKPKPTKPKVLTKMNIDEWIYCSKVDFSNGKYTLMFKDERNSHSLIIESEVILKE